jgi:hypothetical protein
MGVGSALTLSILMSGCMSHRVYRPTDEGASVEAVQSADGAVDYKLAYVEFDDQGELWDPLQLKAAIELIDQENAATDGGVITTIFLHGWKNDASERCERKGNLREFKRVLEQVARNEKGLETAFPSVIKDAQPRRVVGIYVAWRGKCMRTPVLDTFSFFTRRAAALRVGSISMEDSLLRLMHAAKQKDKSKCVVVGYSFGGAILEKTIAQAMVPLLVYASGSRIVIPADLIVVANPASEAALAKQFVEILERSGARLVFMQGGKQIDVDGPLLASITSRADWVTRRAFPTGMYVNNLPRRFRRYPEGQDLPSQRSMASHTAGHVDEMHSHLVIEEKGQPIRLEKKPHAMNTSPYWIMSVSGDIVPAHNQIFGQKFVDLLIQLMNRNMIFSPDVELRLLTDKKPNFPALWERATPGLADTRD